MKLKITMFPSILAILFVCFLPISSFAVVNTKTTKETVNTEPIKTKAFNRANLEVLLGRKLTFRERLFLPLVKNKLAKGLPADRAANEAVTDGMAIAGFVTGVLSLLLFGFILGILGIIFSAVGLKRIRQEPEKRKGRGLAIAGLVCGIIGFIGWTIILLAALASA